MNQLYVLRHGIAVPHGTPNIEDDDRRLTPKGERRIRQTGQALRRLRIKLDRILTSPLPRAARTAELIAEALGIEYLLEPADDLRAGKSAASIREWLSTRSENRLMIVGHDPAFSDLVSLLAAGGPNAQISPLRKGGMAAFRTQSEGKFELDWLARPALFRRLLG